jgi:hypothetical protein
MLLKPVLRYGLPDGRDMLVHHCVSLALIVGSYGAASLANAACCLAVEGSGT